jgi:DNA-binding transcriptional LysR family regulator
MLIWDDIRYFLAVARAGTLSGAARRLGVEHSTVARRIGQLEEAINAKLFHRLARGWALTAEGAELLHKARSVEEEITTFHRTASGMDTLAGTVRISAPPLVLSHLIMPNLGDLAQSHPDLTLELVGERRDADLSRAEADLAVRLREPTEPDLIIRPLGAVTYGLFGLAREIERARLDRVFIGFDDSIPDLPQKSWLEAHAEGCRISVKANDMSVMLQAALAGVGIALLPEFLSRSHPKLKMLKLDVPIIAALRNRRSS